MQVGTKMYLYMRNKSEAVMLTVRRRKDMLIDNVKRSLWTWKIACSIYIVSRRRQKVDRVMRHISSQCTRGKIHYLG